jgi:hypothetical protein
VIVQAGENGPLTADDAAALQGVLRGVDRVVIVNVRVPRSWDEEVNDTLAAAVKRWPEARLADWHDASDREGLLYPDGTHPTTAGQRVYARVVGRAIGG